MFKLDDKSYTSIKNYIERRDKVVDTHLENTLNENIKEELLRNGKEDEVNAKQSISYINDFGEIIRKNEKLESISTSKTSFVQKMKKIFKKLPVINKLVRDELKALPRPTEGSKCNNYKNSIGITSKKEQFFENLQELTNDESEILPSKTNKKNKNINYLNR